MTTPPPWEAYRAQSGPWQKYADTAPPARFSGAGGSWAPSAPPPLAATVKTEDVLKSYAPGFVAAHPNIAGALSGVGDALQGGGRDLINQGLRLLTYASPKAGTAARRAIGDYASPIPGAAETLGRIGTQVGEAVALPEAEGSIPLRMLKSAAMGAGLTGLQGGNPAVGAAGGAGGEALSSGLQKLAPGVMRGALKIRRAEEAYGMAPEEAVLEHTSGFRPATIAKTAREKINELTQATRDQASAASGVGISPAVSLAPAKLGIAQRLAQTPRNADRDIAAVQAVQENLSRFPDQVTPLEAVEARNGINRQFSNYRVEPQFDFKTASRVGKGAARQINEGLEQVLGPQFRANNQTLAGLITAEKRVKSLARGPSIADSVMERFARPTGALTGLVGGGALGYEHGGGRGAVLGGLAGLIAPAVLGSSAGRVALARGLNRGLAVRPAVIAAASLATQK